MIDKQSVERLTAPVSLSADENVGNFASDSYPLTLKVNKLPEPEQLANGDVQNGLYRSNLFNHEESAQPETEEVEEIQCKFIVGCDGARSWVRKLVLALSRPRRILTIMSELWDWS
jgi:phenol 2-monooxygenase